MEPMVVALQMSDDVVDDDDDDDVEQQHMLLRPLLHLDVLQIPVMVLMMMTMV